MHRRKNSQYTTRKLQRPAEIIRVYRELRLLVAGIDRVFFVVTASANCTLILVAIYCVYCGQRLHGVSAVALTALGFTAIALLAVFVNSWAQFHSDSGRVLKVLHSQLSRFSMEVMRTERLLFKRTLISLPRLKIPMMGLFYVDKPVVLKDMKVVCEGIIFLLVNF